MNKRLTLQDLALILAEQTGKEPQEAERFLQEFIAVVTEGVYLDKVVKVKGVGTFKIIRVEERESVSVNSGERFIIPSHYKFTFTPDKDLKELVNQPFSLFETTELNDSVDLSDLNMVSESAENGDSGEESVEEILPEARKIDTPPEPKTPEVEKIEKSTEENRTPLPVEAPSSSANPDDTKKWKALVACLVVIILAGIGYIAYLSDWFVAEKSIASKDVVSLQAENEQIVAKDTVKIEQDTIPASVVDTLPALSQPDSLEDIAVTAIKSGDRLTTIALKYYGHKFFWVYIYKYNQEIISDPNNIPIGTEIRIPAPERYGINAKDRASIEEAAALQTEILANKE